MENRRYVSNIEKECSLLLSKADRRTEDSYQLAFYPYFHKIVPGIKDSGYNESVLLAKKLENREMMDCKKKIEEQFAKSASDPVHRNSDLFFRLRDEQFGIIKRRMLRAQHRVEVFEAEEAVRLLDQEERRRVLEMVRKREDLASHEKKIKEKQSEILKKLENLKSETLPTKRKKKVHVATKKVNHPQSTFKLVINTGVKYGLQTIIIHNTQDPATVIKNFVKTYELTKSDEEKITQHIQERFPMDSTSHLESGEEVLSEVG